jgi:hypothetical protein
MPGILGLTNADKVNKLLPMKDALYKSPFVHCQGCDHIGEAWVVASLRKDKACAEHRNVKIVFEGNIINSRKLGVKLLIWLADLFLQMRFVHRLPAKLGRSFPIRVLNLRIVLFEILFVKSYTSSWQRL